MNSNAIPTYPETHSGACLVCGNAWTLSEDFRRARALRPVAPIMAINGAAGQVPADFLFSIHYEKLPRWIALRVARFEGDFTVHGVGTLIAGKQEIRQAEGTYVDYWWPDARGSGTSTWSGAKIARLMGFTEIILCGMPLEHGTYSDGSLANDFTRARILTRYREAVERDCEWHDGVFSMSGWTREFFGEPA